MKPKMLITMGDSNTEGVGCWHPKTTETTAESYFTNKERFHRLGWPPRLQVKLNYARLINLGQGGSSDSAQLKSFIENISEEELVNYDILVVWLMTFSSRFSFYQGRKVKHIMANNPANEKFPKIHRLSMGYLDFIDNITEDCALEQLYHIRIFRQLCKNSNINFLFASLDDLQRSFLYRNCEKYFNVYNNLDNYADLLEHKSIYPDLFNKPELKSRLCMHPNELGYEVMANHIYTIMQDNFPHLINKEYTNEFQQEWRDYKQW